MDREELERMWSDPANYKWKCIYSCKEDPRVIVPKRPKWAGWTINFAHPDALKVLVSLFLFVLVPVGFTALIWPQTHEGIIAGVVLGIIALIVYCLRMGSRVS